MGCTHSSINPNESQEDNSKYLDKPDKINLHKNREDNYKSMKCVIHGLENINPHRIVESLY